MKKLIIEEINEEAQQNMLLYYFFINLKHINIMDLIMYNQEHSIRC